METMLIPQYRDVKSRLAFCVDRFYDDTLNLMHTLRLQSAEHKISPKLDYILKKIVRDNDIQNNGLMRLLSTCTLEFVKFAVNNETKGRKLKIQQEMEPTETLDRTLKNELKEKINSLEKLKKLHTNTMQSLIEKQKDLWKLNKKHQSKAEDKAKLAYLELIASEEKVRKEMNKISETILNDLQDRVSSRLSDALEVLRWLVADFVSSDRSANLLSAINSTDVITVTREIIESFCKPYRYAVPSEYFRFHDYDRQLLKAPQTMDKEQFVITLDLDEDKDLKLYMNKFSLFATKKSGFERIFSNIFGKKKSKHLEDRSKVKNNADKYKQIYFS